MTKSDYYKLRTIWQDLSTVTMQTPERPLYHYNLEQALENLVEFRAAFTTDPDVAGFFKSHHLQVLTVKTYDASHDEMPGYIINLVYAV